MKVLVTGSKGFIAKNLILRLRELKKYEILEYHKGSSLEELKDLVAQADFIFHLAGVNRPQQEKDFHEGNFSLTEKILNVRYNLGLKSPIVFSSSIQAELENPYGKSKKAAEEILLQNEKSYVFRLPNVFGKWSRPNYNSVVATFCHNIANDLPISINDRSTVLRLIYIDDVVTEFISLLISHETGHLRDSRIIEAKPVYTITLGELADTIKAFKESRQTLITERVGQGITRALHATYLSFLKPGQFTYEVPRYEDPRGVFVEMLKTKDSGQFSFFTAHPGITRGGHYHHTKTEKFLVIKGKARYKFLHMDTQETCEVVVDSSKESPILETIPGWSHDITNIGEDELVVMLWANEIFDRQNPDTIAHKV
ncbi:capsular biosynthesis protein [Bdellovibrio bacteriovorus]|uniref:Capsular biosynthesis protein n=1 Tax=Bdellovibrio bacteriovorus TaxID=959 RepID=A0A150WLF5_BDEBC|nr:NAD-dependent epimerase/dehydratase family protein [Bdellovibrio bacteriovorus]KYG64722.1 capsular biosynthesis protein [Bdellovibrio bacteriovorus]